MSEQFFDDVLDLSKNTRRKYRIINNSDGTVSFEDVTVYLQEGSKFGADEVNDLMSLSDDVANTKPNLIPFPYYSGMSKTHNGITFTVNADGSVTLNGTSTAVSTFHFTTRSDEPFIRLKKGRYRVSGGVNANIQISASYGNAQQSIGNIGADSGNGLVFDVTDTIANYNIQMWINIKSGYTVDNLTIYPMLIEGETAPTEYKMFGNMTCVGTLASGETTLELASDKITTSSMIEPPYFYITDGSEVEPISYNTVKVENGKVTYTFDALASDLIVGVKVM